MRDTRKHLHSALCDLESKHAKELQSMTAQHERTLATVQKSEREMPAKIERVRAESAESHPQHQEEPARQQAQPQQIVLLWWPFFKTGNNFLTNIEYMFVRLRAALERGLVLDGIVLDGDSTGARLCEVRAARIVCA